MTYVYNYLKDYKFMNETSYPYVADDTTCGYDSTKGIVNTIGYSSVTANSSDAHILALASQPVVIAM